VDLINFGWATRLEVEDCLVMARASLLEGRKRFAALSGLLEGVGSQMESARIALEAVRSGFDAYEEAGGSQSSRGGSAAAGAKSKPRAGGPGKRAAPQPVSDKGSPRSGR
jgi:hypothetical protein